MKRGREDGASGGLAAGKKGASAKPASGPNAPSKLTTNDALSYLREVKNRFADNKDVYDTFLEIMKQFKAQKFNTSDVISRVKQLFKGHRELVLGFNTFLPKGFEIELARVSSDDDDDEDEEDEEEEVEVVVKEPLEFDSAITYVNKIKVCFSGDERVYKAFLEILNQYRKGQKTIRNVYDEVAVLFRDHKELLDEFTYFLPDNSQPKSSSARGRQPRMAMPPAPSDPRSVHKRKAARKAEEGFKAGYGSGSYEDSYADPSPRAPALSKEHQFFDRVKQRLRNRDAYSDLLKCLHLFSKEIVPRHELIHLVSNIIGKFPDLMNGFLEVLGKHEVKDTELAGGAKPNNQLVMQYEMQRQKQLQTDKYMTKPLSEIVAHNQERVTPSYVRIPSGYPKLLTSGRSELALAILNDTFVNVITGSEDYSFKLMRKNQYEEALFRCEDDRYDLEMCIMTNFTALKLLRPIVELTERMSPEERSGYQLESGHVLLGPVPANAIQRLYAESGVHIVDQLRRHPGVVASVVVARLEAKDAEWRKVREEMTKTWSRLHEINYHKSLDHRSFYFKQAEKKSLLPKAMVAEIREAADQRKARAPRNGVEASYQTARMSEVSRPAPDLTFDYDDSAVFADCWAVLQTVIMRSPGSGSKQRVVELYLATMEPFFGLAVRQDQLDKLKAEMRENRAARKGATGDDSANDSSGHDEDVKCPPETTPEPGDNTDMDADEGAGRGGRRSRARTPFKREESHTSDADVADVTEEEPSHTRRFMGCTPLAPYEAPSTAESAAATCDKPSRLLLCNELVFIVFRLHRHLYERMRTARRCSQRQAVQQRVWHQHRQIAAPAVEGSMRTPEELLAEAQMSEQADRVHASFMALTQQVLTGELETVPYEDQVRALLGTNSYELFTIEALLRKLVSHMHVLVQDESSVKMLELHEYEQSRGDASHAAYRVNAHVLIDDATYRIEFRPDSSELIIRLLEGDLLEAPLQSGQCQPDEGPISHYLASFLSESATALSAPSRRISLVRSLTAQQRSEEVDEVLMSALQQVAVSNGLECKVACTTNKVSYVLDTEDVMCRPGRVMKRGSDTHRQVRCQRFHSWLEEAINRAKAEEEAVLALAGPNAMST